MATLPGDDAGRSCPFPLTPETWVEAAADHGGPLTISSRSTERLLGGTGDTVARDRRVPPCLVRVRVHQQAAGDPRRVRPSRYQGAPVGRRPGSGDGRHRRRACREERDRGDGRGRVGQAAHRSVPACRGLAGVEGIAGRREQGHAHVERAGAGDCRRVEVPHAAGGAPGRLVETRPGRDSGRRRRDQQPGRAPADRPAPLRGGGAGDRRPVARHAGDCGVAASLSATPSIARCRRES